MLYYMYVKVAFLKKGLIIEGRVTWDFDDGI